MSVFLPKDCCKDPGGKYSYVFHSDIRMCLTVFLPKGNDTHPGVRYTPNSIPMRISNSASFKVQHSQQELAHPLPGFYKQAQWQDTTSRRKTHTIMMSFTSARFATPTRKCGENSSPAVGGQARRRNGDVDTLSCSSHMTLSIRLII